jgi:sigma-B regulation protein RsbU (phosphoserine phosphatase)
MDLIVRVQDLWRKMRRPKQVFLVLLVVYLAIRLLSSAESVPRLLAGLAVVVLGCWAGVGLARRGMRKAIWRLRNRLLVAYLFIAVVPLILVGVLTALSAKWLATEFATYLVNSQFDQRIGALRNSAEALERAPASERKEIVARIGAFFEQRYPGIELLLQEGGVEYHYPARSGLKPPPKGWGNTSGVVVKDGLLHAWAHIVEHGGEVTILAPLTRRFLAELAPGIGEVSLVHFPDLNNPTREPEMRLHNPAPGEEAAELPPPPKPVNRLDMEVLWATPIPVAVWESPTTASSALLSVHSRISAVLGVVFSQRNQSGLLLNLLYLFAGVFLVVEIVSLYIGVSITQTITGAVHDLYQGTERVRQGDFSHRIEVRGDDQIAVVSDSFNRMTENLERLLVVAKEKERMQTELEIAREVQGQLYPKTVPALKTLELRALCNPARMVSGDYYDYQALQNRCAALAIGDVAGKGISAALLMATLQAALRTHLRSSMERATAAGHDGHLDAISTSRLVAQLNQQLYADTAPEKYATFCFSVYEDTTGMLKYTNAGHLPPLLVRRGQAIVVGAFPFAKYEESGLQLEPGDLLAYYTDGITEPENEYGEMFGEQRLIDVLVRNAHKDPDQVIAAVMDAVGQWTRSPELQDDMTLLLARRH